jgi:hypothetical protein
MITKDNLTEVLNSVTEKDISEAMNAKSDYVALWLSSYGHVNLESINLFKDEEREEDILATGGLICDKDDFLRLFTESESINPFIIQYL